MNRPATVRLRPVISMRSRKCGSIGLMFPLRRKASGSQAHPPTRTITSTFIIQQRTIIRIMAEKQRGNANGSGPPNTIGTNTRLIRGDECARRTIP